ALVVDPPAFVTVIGPSTAVAGTIARSSVFDTRVNDAVADGDPNATRVVPVKAEPSIVTAEPGAADVGENELIAGRTRTRRPRLVAAGVVTARKPVSASDGIVAVSCVALSMPNGTSAAPSLSVLAPR